MSSNTLRSYVGVEKQSEKPCGRGLLGGGGEKLESQGKLCGCGVKIRNSLALGS